MTKQDKKQKGYYRLRMIYSQYWLLQYDRNFKPMEEITVGPYHNIEEAKDRARVLRENGIINLDTVGELNRIVPYSDKEKFK
jgi:hypothetical protein